MVKALLYNLKGWSLNFTSNIINNATFINKISASSIFLNMLQFISYMSWTILSDYFVLIVVELYVQSIVAHVLVVAVEAVCFCALMFVFVFSYLFMCFFCSVWLEIVVASNLRLILSWFLFFFNNLKEFASDSKSQKGVAMLTQKIYIILISLDEFICICLKYFFLWFDFVNSLIFQLC